MPTKETARNVRQRFPQAEEVVEALRIACEEHPLEHEYACSLFEAFVNPETSADEHPTTGSIARMNMAFTEWFLFDCDIFDGRTLLDLMAQDDPTLAECAQTQFYSRFWVIEQDKERKRAVLRDTATRQDYVVRSPHIATTKRWAKGTLGTRIARAHGVWREVGQMALHDNAPSTPLSALPARRLQACHDPAAFIVNIEQLIGRDGAFASSARCMEL